MKILFTVIITFGMLLKVSAQDSLKTYNLGEIEISALKYTKLNNVQISKKDFLMYNAGTVFESLQFTPGVYASVSGKNEAKLTMRGFDQRQISVMIDGAPVYIPYDGSMDLAAIQLTGFSKVLISKSNASVLYGPNSMGGSINIISEDPVKNFSANLDYQEGSSRNIKFGLNGRFSQFYYNAGFGYLGDPGFVLPRSFDGALNENGAYRDNSSYYSKAGLMKIGTTIIKNSNIAFAYNFIENEKDVPINIYTRNPRFWRYKEWNKSLANLMFTSAINSSITFKGNIYYDKYKNILDSYDDAGFNTRTKKFAFESTYDDHSYGFNLSSYISSSLLPLTKLIFLYKRDTHNEQEDTGHPFRKYEAEILTLGAEEEFKLTNSIKTAAGISYNKMVPVFAENITLRPASSALNANIGASLEIKQSIYLFVNSSVKTRFPTLKEFYAEVPGTYAANYDLSPERSLNAEAGFTYYSALFSADAAVFYSGVKDLIQAVILDNQKRQYRNISRSEFLGTELAVRSQLKFVNININYSYLYSQNLSDDTRLPNRPANTLNFLLDKDYNSGFQWNTELSMISGQYSLFDSKEIHWLSGYLLLNARVAQKISSWFNIYFRVNNITDKYYETEYGFPQPGREYFIGFNTEW